MKIFVSGIAGFLGSHLAESFIKDGHKVVGCDSLIGGELDNVPPEAEFFQYDCCVNNLFGSSFNKYWVKIKS